MSREIWTPYGPREGYWDPHYRGDDGLPGPLKVYYRRQLNYMLDEGVEPLEPDPFAVNVLKQVGVKNSTPKVDVGSGGEFKYLYEWAKEGDPGPHIAIEPNPEQAPSMPFLAFPYPAWHHGLHSPEASKPNKDYYRQIGKIMLRGISGQRITLIKSDANFLPFEDESIEAVTWLFSGYCIEKDLQLPAMIEAARVLGSRGVFLSGFSHKGSKNHIRFQEKAINNNLSSVLGVECIKPIPISAGLTTLEAVDLACKVFDKVWLYEHLVRMIFNTPQRLDGLWLAHTTTRDLHLIPTRITDGVQQFRIPTMQEFRDSYMATVGEEIRKANIKKDGKGGRIEDFLMQGYILATNNNLKKAPAGFVPVK